MSLKIIKAGILDSVQDMGRNGFQSLGINPTGVMDHYAAAIANILVGNAPGEAVIESHFPGPVIRFEEPAVIALSGADFNAVINGQHVPVDHPLYVHSDSVLEFRSVTSKSKVYLAVKGGFKIVKWLDSYSTNLKAEAGGHEGRKLGKDDIIGFNENMNPFTTFSEYGCRIMPWKVNHEWEKEPSNDILVLEGSEWNWLDDISREKFMKNVFYVSPQSDRMGYRLASEPLRSVNRSELISSPVTFGTIQLLPEGQLIILMADHQTAGGYPRIAHIISSCLSRIAQMNAGEDFRFSFTDHKTAEQFLLKQSRHLHQLQIACKFRLQNFIVENN